LAEYLEASRLAMTFETKIKQLRDRYLADAHAPDIAGFVDQLFHVAAETGAVACVFDGDTRLRFFVREARAHGQTVVPEPARPQAPCIVEHAAARAVLRMICARLGVVCKERTATDVSPYGAKAEIEYDVQDHRRWSVSYTNTAQSQEFAIEAL
jgi:hypothetical protein